MFIAIDGMDGTGKTTLAALLAERLHTKGKNVLRTKPLGGDKVSAMIRAMALDPEIDVTMEAMPFLMIADKIQIVHSVILPAMAKGITVITDRYLPSTMVYQIDTVDTLTDIQKALLIDALQLWVPVPDLTFILDIPVGVAEKRLYTRNAKGMEFNKKDVFEDVDTTVMEARKSSYLKYPETTLGNKAPVCIISLTGSESPEDIVNIMEANITYLEELNK